MKAIAFWKQQILTMEEAEAHLSKSNQGLARALAPDIIQNSLTIFNRLLKSGMYVINSRSGIDQYLLSVTSNGSIINYKIAKQKNDSVALLDPKNGNREFPSLEALVTFYKTVDMQSKYALAHNLLECLQPVRCVLSC